MGQLYKFPTDWKFVPKVYKLNPNWQNKIEANGNLKLNNDNGLVHYYYVWEPKRYLNIADIILLQEQEGKLIRQTEPIILVQHGVNRVTI